MEFVVLKIQPKGKCAVSMAHVGISVPYDSRLLKTILKVCAGPNLGIFISSAQSEPMSVVEQFILIHWVNFHQTSQACSTKIAKTNLIRQKHGSQGAWFNYRGKENF